MAPWRVPSINFGSSNGFCDPLSPLPGIVNSFLVPLDPSIIVTVFDPGGGGSTVLTAASDEAGGELAEPSWRACCLPSASPSRAVVTLDGALVATTAVGSPPRGSLTKAAHATTTKPETPSTPASSCGPETGNVGSRFRLSWPRGAFRSSTKARGPRESSRKSTTRRFRHRPVMTGLNGDGAPDQKQMGRPRAAPLRVRKDDAISSGPESSNLAGMPNSPAFRAEDRAPY